MSWHKTNENNEMNNLKIIQWNGPNDRRWQYQLAFLFDAECLFVYFLDFLYHISLFFPCLPSSPFTFSFHQILSILSSIQDFITASSYWFYFFPFWSWTNTLYIFFYLTNGNQISKFVYALAIFWLCL